MPAPADPAVRERALELVADGVPVARVADKVGVHQTCVRKWARAAGFPAHYAERLQEAQDRWDDLRYVPGPENAAESKPRGLQRNVERPNLYVPPAGSRDHEIRKPVELADAMSRWRTRVAHYGAEDLSERYLRAHDPCGR